MSDEQELDSGVEPTSESAPENNAGEVSQPDSNRNPGVEKRISSLTKKLYHKDTQLEQLTAELETLKKVGAQSQPEPQEAVELPDESLRYDNPDEYKQKIEAFHKAQAAKAYQEAQSQFQQEQEQSRVKAEQEKAQEKMKSVVDNYLDRGIEAGINEERMLANEQVLKQANIDPGLANRLYSHTDGARIVDYLASNPDKLASLTQQNIMDAAVTLATEITPAALATKSETTNAPDPVAPTTGGGIPPADEWARLAPGATFE